MKAAVVSQLGLPPSQAEFREPVAGEGEVVVAVRAAPLSPIVRSLASGRHYTSGKGGDFVAGVDGVGIDPGGRRVYFLFPKAPFGSMAEKSLVSNDLLAPVPEALTDEQAAALVSAGLASWVALTRRAPMHGAGTVMVIGATGAAGAMAVQVARHLGASKVIAVGRNEQKLARLDANVVVALNADADAALRVQFDQGVDVVLDFVWGEPALRVLRAATKGRGSRAGEPKLRYVQIGTAAGDEISVRGDMLRSTGLELVGSGVGSVSVPELLAGARELLAVAATAGFRALFETVPLSAISEAWTQPSEARCIVLPNC
jgi:NADPH:quinone reductase-like Zn-dependent oxidoreductase